MHIKFFTGFEIVFYHNFLLPFQVRTTFFHVILIMNFFRLPNQYQEMALSTSKLALDKSTGL